MTANDVTVRIRALATALEPVVGSVYFAPEAHAAFAALGFGGSSGRVTDDWSVAHWGEVEMPDGQAYFASRGSLLGQVPGEVVAAAFGVFNPAVVVPLVADSWARTDAATICRARDTGAIAQLVRILGSSPAGLERATELLDRAASGLSIAGRPLYAGLVALPLPAEPVGAMWRLAERLREFRGDAHVCAFATMGFDGCEIQLLTERCADMPKRTYVLTHAWTEDDVAAAEARLTDRGLLAAGDATAAGRAAREEVEELTDRPCRPMIEALGGDDVALVGILQTWGAAIRAANGYYISSPQEALMDDRVQDWMTNQGLPRFAGADVHQDRVRNVYGAMRPSDPFSPFATGADDGAGQPTQQEVPRG